MVLLKRNIHLKSSQDFMVNKCGWFFKPIGNLQGRIQDFKLGGRT